MLGLATIKDIPTEQFKIAIVYLKSGEQRVSKKIQAEDDTLFAQSADYSIYPIPFDSIARIEVLANSDTSALKRRPLTSEEKAVLADVGIRGAVWALLVLPVLLAAWFVNGYLDSF